jgi:hypothetical protein
VKVPLPAAGRRNAPTATATQLIGVRPIGKSVNIDEPSHPPAISAKYGSLEQQSLTILVHLFLLQNMSRESGNNNGCNKVTYGWANKSNAQCIGVGHSRVSAWW